MFEPRHHSSGGSSANRWLIVAGAGLVVLAFVARMLLNIGHTSVSDLAAAIRPDTTPSTAVAAAATIDSVMPPPAMDPAPDTTTMVPVPPPVAAPRVPAPPAPTARGYAVQIGAFGSEGNATRLSKRATSLGYPASVIPEARSTSTLYLVRVNGLSSPEQARVAADSLARALKVRSVIITPRP